MTLWRYISCDRSSWEGLEALYDMSDDDNCSVNEVNLRAPDIIRSKKNGISINMLVDSGATSHYLDDQLIPGLKDKMDSYKCLDQVKQIRTAGSATIYGTAEGILPVTFKSSTGKVIHGQLEATIAPGIGRHLFSVGQANKKAGIKTVISDKPCLILRDGTLISLQSRKNVFTLSLRLGGRPTEKEEQLLSMGLWRQHDTSTVI